MKPTPQNLKEVVNGLNATIEYRRQLLVVYGDQIEMVFINGHVHDCSVLPESNVYFRGKVIQKHFENVIPLRRTKLCCPLMKN